MSEFGRQLQELRRRRRMTQKRLATLSGVSPSYLSRVERGERNAPHPAVLKKMAQALAVSEYELLAMAGYLTPPENSGLIPAHWYDLMSDPSLDETVRQLGQLTEREKQTLGLYLEAIKLNRKDKD